MPTCKQPIAANLTTDERDPANWPAAALQQLQGSSTIAAPAVTLEIEVTRIYALRGRNA